MRSGNANASDVKEGAKGVCDSLKVDDASSR